MRGPGVAGVGELLTATSGEVAEAFALVSTPFFPCAARAKIAASATTPPNGAQTFHAPRRLGGGWPGRLDASGLPADCWPCLRARFRRFLEFITTFLFYHSAGWNASLTRKIDTLEAGWEIPIYGSISYHCKT